MAEVCSRCNHYKLKGNYRSRVDKETSICKPCHKDEQTMEDWKLVLPEKTEWPVTWKPPERYETLAQVSR